MGVLADGCSGRWMFWHLEQMDVMPCLKTRKCRRWPRLTANDDLRLLNIAFKYSEIPQPVLALIPRYIDLGVSDQKEVDNRTIVGRS